MEERRQKLKRVAKSPTKSDPSSAAVTPSAGLRPHPTQCLHRFYRVGLEAVKPSLHLNARQKISAVVDGWGLHGHPICHNSGFFCPTSVQ